MEAGGYLQNSTPQKLYRKVAAPSQRNGDRPELVIIRSTARSSIGSRFADDHSYLATVGSVILVTLQKPPAAQRQLLYRHVHGCDLHTHRLAGEPFSFRFLSCTRIVDAFSQSR